MLTSIENNFYVLQQNFMYNSKRKKMKLEGRKMYFKNGSDNNWGRIVSWGSKIISGK